MPRPSKQRKIDALPEFNEFTSENAFSNQAVYLTLDEYETIRLLDYDCLKQEECAERMGVARTSITAIYESARHKIADALIHGKKLYITGGNCVIQKKQKNTAQIDNLRKKGETMVRIAVCYDNGEIFQHFGRTPSFKVYDVEDGQIIDSRVFDTNGSGHGALAGLLTYVQVDALICGGMGMGAQYALSDAGIRVFAGVSGNADEAIQSFLKGTLEYTTDATCDHHEGHEGCDCGEDHDCDCGEENHECGCGGEGHGGCGCHN